MRIIKKLINLARPKYKVIFSGTCAGSFRGYKRVNTSYYKIDKCLENCAYFSEVIPDNKFKGHKIELKYYRNDDCIKVFIDDKVVGYVWNSYQYFNLLLKAKASAFYFMLESEFVMDAGEEAMHERKRPRLFAKFD